MQENKVDVAILSEIKINNKSKLKLTGYDIYLNYKNNDSWPSGGVVVIVRKKFTVKSIVINKYIPIESIKIISPIQKTTFIYRNAEIMN